MCLVAAPAAPIGFRLPPGDFAAATTSVPAAAQPVADLSVQTVVALPDNSAGAERASQAARLARRPAAAAADH
jgi:hypothetical protein